MPGNDPAGTGRQIGDPPGALAGVAARRQKPQEVDLLADLRDQREHDGRGGAEQHEVERVSLAPARPVKFVQRSKRCAVGGRDISERNEMQDDPDRLRP